MSNMPDTMNPDDFAALMQIAGPLYAQSKIIEQETVQNPLVNSHTNDGSLKIRQALERAEHDVKNQVRQQHIQQYVAAPDPHPYMGYYVETPSPTNMPPPVPVAPTYIPVPQPQEYRNNDQLEFSFDPSKQDVTNDLLKEISTKLSKILGMLEKKENPSPSIKKQQV